MNVKCETILKTTKTVAIDKFLKVEIRIFRTRVNEKCQENGF